jgi:hypothetical protein
MFSVDPYLARRFDEETYNCWDLVREAWLELTGFDIGNRTPHPATPLAIARRFRDGEREFCRLGAPCSPSIVVMKRPRAVPHAGLFLRGRVLHIHPGGPQFDRLADATRGFDKVGFYATDHTAG